MAALVPDWRRRWQDGPDGGFNAGGGAGRRVIDWRGRVPERPGGGAEWRLQCRVPAARRARARDSDWWHAVRRSSLPVARVRLSTVAAARAAGGANVADRARFGEQRPADATERGTVNSSATGQHAQRRSCRAQENASFSSSANAGLSSPLGGVSPTVTAASGGGAVGPAVAVSTPPEAPR